jgi:multidrug efflux pump subunit AcrA (membrane-fusion protein)
MSTSRWFSPFRIGLAVIVVAAALVAWDLTRSSSPTYRTSVVSTGTVVATLDSVGTIAPVNQAGLDFNASGTVAAVDVSVGQAVTAGQTLASLDLATLNASVVSAEAAVASAKAALASAEASETATATTANVASTTSPSSSSASATTAGSAATATAATPAVTATTVPPSGSGSGSSGGRSTTNPTVAQLQTTLVADQTLLDSESTLAGVSLQQATAQCGTSTSSPSSSSTSTTTGPSSGSASASGACSAALSQASSAQTAVAADIKQVSADEGALTSALEASSSTGSDTSTGSTKTGTTTSGGAASSTGSASSGSGSTSSASSGSGGLSAKRATPQQVAVDQASVDTAEATLSDAQQAVAGANLISTISGTVASVSIAAGDSVTAGSTTSTAQVVVIGGGSSYQVTTDIAVADIGKVSVGQEALVTPDSTNTVEKGEVSAIGVVATTGTTTTDPVTVSLDSRDLGQLSGVDGNVEIIVTRSVGVTTVPSSAIRTVGSIHLVTVVKDGTPTPVRVTLGTVGDILTQVTTGLVNGQVVSLADVDQPLPSTSSSTTRSAFGGAGLSGGGFGGAGFSGGSFGGGAGGGPGGRAGG